MLTRHRATGIELVLLALSGGLAASLVLTLVTGVLAYWGPQRGGYGLAGNTALAFAYQLLPASVSGGWTALALHLRRRRGAVPLGIGAGLVAAGLVVAYYAIAIGSGRESGLAVLSLGWAAGVPLLALVLPLPAAQPARPTTGADIWWHAVAAAGLFLVVVGLGFGLEPCAPALGTPAQARQFALCLPGGFTVAGTANSP